MKRQRRAIALTLALVIMLVVVPFALLFRAVRQEQRDQVLVAAVKRNDENAVLRLLAQGASPDVRDLSDTPPPPRSLWQRLLAAFRRKPATTKVGTPVLMQALDQTEIKSRIVLALINAGADVNVGDGLDIPLHRACANSSDSTYRQSVEIISALLQYGAQVNATDAYNSTPLMLATDGPPLLLQLLLSHGAQVNARDKEGKTALYSLCVGSYRPGRVANAKLLLAYGADVNLADEHQEPPLMTAIVFDDIPLATLLLAHHARVNARNVEGRTALFYVESPAMARLLLKHGADILARDDAGVTAYKDTHQIRYHPDVIRFLRQRTPHGKTRSAL